MSKIEVDAIDKQSGSTLTLGGSGTAVTLASGATQSGFGRTGTVDWQTSIKTSTFTAVSGEGYFVNTTGGAVTVNLPAGSAGAIVSIKDYAQTFDTHNCTIAANGSEKIESLTTDLILSTEGVAVTLIYGDATKGWQAVNSNEIKNTPRYVTATGGNTVATSGNFKIHTFTGPGTFTVTCGGSCAGSNTVDYLVVAAGGGGGGTNGGAGGGSGGGAGGYRESSGGASGCYTRSPLGACVAALPVSAQAYPITVGGGGTPGPSSGPSSDKNAGNGNNSIFSTITATGGGGGKGGPCGSQNGEPGGSGGGASGGDPAPRSAGSGNTPPVSPPQGNDGGSHTQPTGKYNSAGGGGATAAGTGVQPANTSNGVGGAGATSCITASPVTRAAGAPGGKYPTSGPDATPGSAGPANSGNGGQGATGAPGSSPSTNPGGSGGSGIVVIRYKFQ